MMLLAITPAEDLFVALTARAIELRPQAGLFPAKMLFAFDEERLPEDRGARSVTPLRPAPSKNR